MKKMKIWAHRGASGYAPENTMEAFSEAVRRKADGIELDVQLTKDGEIVVIHDEKLERVSNGTGWVKDYTLKELRKLNFNKTFPEQGSARIPTLKEVYELMKKEDMLVNVELKTSIVFYEGLVDKVLDLAARMGMEEKVLYSSFNHYTLLEIKKKNPGTRTGMLFEDGCTCLWETSGCGCASSYICAFAASRFSGTVQGGEAASACVDREYKRTLPADGESRRGCCDHQFSGYTILVIVWRKALWKAK